MAARETYDILLAAYGRPRWWSDDAFTVMFQSVLVQNPRQDGCCMKKLVLLICLDMMKLNAIIK